jgi:hypothetical protein
MVVNPKRNAQGVPNSMTYGQFADLKQALEGALAFEHGERRGLKVTLVQGSSPPNALRAIETYQKRFNRRRRTGALKDTPEV